MTPIITGYGEWRPSKLRAPGKKVQAQIAYFDDNGHGTHCAGTIAAVGNNSIGVAGVNWKAKIISVRVLDPDGGGSDEDIMAGINYVTGLLAANPNLNIASVNFSVGGSEDLNFDVVDRTYAYQSFNGTSMAAPHVAGAVALLKSLYPKATTKRQAQSL